MPSSYRGRLAPSPTGFLHLGHARTFWTAQERAVAAHGTLILRNEDLDRSRSRAEFVEAMLEDLRWFGFRWQEGPDCGGPFAPYSQSERHEFYRAGFEALKSRGCIYPCYCSRQDVLRALSAPHAGDGEPIYPGTCRNNPMAGGERKANWRFRAPDGEAIEFVDGGFGNQRFVTGRDFGDFVIWRHDETPSYQLAVVLDDSAMKVTEVVRGADLLLSTARQLLLYRALGLEPPNFFHCPLVTDQSGSRLAKRSDALSLRTLRKQGLTPEEIRRDWGTK
jgi:glutamyl-tRNA synthetase